MLLSSLLMWWWWRTLYVIIFFVKMIRLQNMRENMGLEIPFRKGDTHFTHVLITPTNVIIRY